MDLWNAFAGDDSPGTALANLVTIVGVLGVIRIALSISATIQASLAVNAQAIHRSLKLVNPQIEQSKAGLPPGDFSRVLYATYEASRVDNERYWNGHLQPQKLPRDDLVAYNRHVAEALFLLDRAIAHAPSTSRADWLGLINVHVCAHSALLRRWVWWIRGRFYSQQMRKLIAMAAEI